MATAELAPQPAFAQSPRPRSIEHRFVLFILAFFAGWPALKFANVQWLEMFMLAHLLFLLFAFAYRGFKTHLVGYWINPGRWFGAILLTILALSISSLRLRRYPPMYGPYFLHFPLEVVMLRYIEFFVVAFYGLYAAELMRRDTRLRDFAMRTYVGSALVTILITFFGLLIFYGTGTTFGVNGEARGNGMFPEGGPWGLYLLTVAFALRVLWKRRAITHPQMVVATIMMGWAFYICRSKAAVFCAVLIFVTQIFFGHNLRQKVLSAVAIVGVCAAAWFAFDVPGLYDVLSATSRNAEIAAYMNPHDGNTAYGRVAGSVVVPRMIADHPLTGIGFGNYPVMRNNPKYLGIMFPDRYYDLPGLGLLSVAAEIGVPSLLALYMMMLYPAWRVRTAHGNPMLLTLALCQPFVHLLGAQITLFYPWMASAFVLSFLPLPGRERGALKSTADMTPKPTAPLAAALTMGVQG